MAALGVGEGEGWVTAEGEAAPAATAAAATAAAATAPAAVGGVAAALRDFLTRLVEQQGAQLGRVRLVSWGRLALQGEEPPAPGAGWIDAERALGFDRGGDRRRDLYRHICIRTSMHAL